MRLAFEHIDGQTWNTATYPGLLDELGDLLARLYEDSRLAAQLGDRARSYRHCRELRYREQYEEDLKAVRASRPESVTDARLSWMEREARMDLHLRAVTLDFLIDVLADWAECGVPEWRERVQRQKESEHERYLDWYLSRRGWPETPSRKKRTRLLAGAEGQGLTLTNLSLYLLCLGRGMS